MKITKQEALDYVRESYCNDDWQAVIAYFGEEEAEALDLYSHMPYEDVLARNDKDECVAFYHLAVIQRVLITALYDLGTNDDAMLTFVYLEYMLGLLYDAAHGEETLWIH